GTLPPRARRAAGLCVGPEERLGHAAAPTLSLTENALLTADTREELSHRGFINWPKTRGFAEKVIQGFDVRTPGPEAAAQSLSGGNLQKFVMGREMLQAPKALVINQPTWGVDAAAAASIRQKLLEMAEQGVAIIVISQDLDELFEIADRFAALNEGKLSDTRPMAELSMDEIGLMLGGAHGAADGIEAA
ncbi:MAG: ABC transporter ATP-binding protein, partial [Pseudomonadota bacterium]